MKDQDYVFYHNIGLRIKDERIKQGLSQAELAEKAGLSLPVISSIENGRSSMWLITFAKILLALQVAADDILKLPLEPDDNPKELSGLLSRCSPSEYEAIITVIKEIRKVFDEKHDK